MQLTDKQIKAIEELTSLKLDGKGNNNYYFGGYVDDKILCIYDKSIVLQDYSYESIKMPIAWLRPLANILENK